MANEGRENNANWDGIWDVATRITETGWFAEIRIPFRTLQVQRRTTPQTWGVNFERKLRRLNEDSYWAPLPRIYDIQRVSLAGTLERHARACAPARTSASSRTRSAAPTRSRTATRPAISTRGFDVKYGVTSGLTWDFTVNTDFSQVEADEQQINLSRFSLFFPEKRDFFLENSGHLPVRRRRRRLRQPVGGGGGGGTATRQNASQDMRLFFSRASGCRRTAMRFRSWPARGLTGRAGPYSMGALNIQQREQGRPEAVPAPTSRPCACGATSWRTPTSAPSC